MYGKLQLAESAAGCSAGPGQRCDDCVPESMHAYDDESLSSPSAKPACGANGNTMLLDRVSVDVRHRQTLSP